MTRINSQAKWGSVQRKGGRQANRAFTIIELLVVIAVISMLIALLLPAVQAARESSRRMACSNHIRQAALAVQLYANTTTQQYLPTDGYLAADNADDQTGNPPGAAPIVELGGAGSRTVTNPSVFVHLLPHLEQTNIYALFDIAKGRFRTCTATDFPNTQADATTTMGGRTGAWGISWEAGADLSALHDADITVLKCGSSPLGRTDERSSYAAVAGGTSYGIDKNVRNPYTKDTIGNDPSNRADGNLGGGNHLRWTDITYKTGGIKAYAVKEKNDSAWASRSTMTSWEKGASSQLLLGEISWDTNVAMPSQNNAGNDWTGGNVLPALGDQGSGYNYQTAAWYKGTTAQFTGQNADPVRVRSFYAKVVTPFDRNKLRGSYADSSEHPIINAVKPNMNDTAARQGFEEFSNAGSWGSMHPGTMNISFGDGRAQSISDMTSSQVLCNWADPKAVMAPSL